MKRIWPCKVGRDEKSLKSTDLDDGKITCGMFIDLAKAFNTANHSILLTKIDHYGIRENVLHLIQSYLENRVQFVQINNHISINKTIMCDVPQGSILGPTLFLLYVNDIQNITNFEVRLFSDNTLLYLFDTDSQTLKKNVNAKLNKVK